MDKFSFNKGHLHAPIIIIIGNQLSWRARLEQLAIGRLIESNTRLYGRLPLLSQ